MSIKYRPSLTITEIQHLINVIDWSSHYQDYEKELDAVKRKLEVFTLKAQHGITQGSHITVGKQSLESQLGLAEDETIATLLDAFASNPGLLSTKQLERVQLHRYTNDLMTKDEEHAYESRAETFKDWAQ